MRLRVVTSKITPCDLPPIMSGRADNREAKET